ncbi:hypothetical protein JF535_14950 [Microbulbifer salipaludis]|uniref:Basal-body rod modification protein FlgD n=1 Tax=Microbulbifer salipaludis TaxID=187980 RepID=A0ABS3EAE2_9GAMM|nr:flagellar hook capping FlgD N-terminal domain-containing protein [Microbulbifer salipaludis]MBN8432148.1 hypothetical protein [Microbulbifer salipaludis]
MSVDAIGSVLGNTEAESSNSISQEEFLRLFLAQLQFQDPMEPLDNSEFLAQLAQFSSIEQNRQNGLQLENIARLNSSYQASELLGRSVEVSSDSGSLFGSISAVSFDGSGTTFTVNATDGNVVSGLRLSQIRVIRQ